LKTKPSKSFKNTKWLRHFVFWYEAPPHTIWVLICPDTGGYSYKSNPRKGFKLSFYRKQNNNRYTTVVCNQPQTKRFFETLSKNLLWFV